MGPVSNRFLQYQELISKLFNRLLADGVLSEAMSKPLKSEGDSNF